MAGLRSVRIFLFAFLANILFGAAAFSQNINLLSFEELENSRQLYHSSDSLISFCVRPVHTFSNNDIDAAYRNGSFKKTNTNGFLQAASGRPVFLPVSLRQQYNSHHPYGFNDGSMIPAKGYQAQLSSGIFWEKGFLSLQLQPDIVFAQNNSFPSFPSQHKDSIWRSYYNTVLNIIDAPEKFGSRSYAKLFPGQSALRFNYRKLSFGISSENLWWGPGVRNSLLMSNNAPGFLHLTFNSIQPAITSVGSFEWQLISGRLKNSGISPDTTRTFNGQPLYIPKQGGDRYLNGMVITWQPKWTRGLFLGFSRIFYQNLSEVHDSFDGYLPILGKFFKKKLTTEDDKRRDQLISVFFRLAFFKDKAELYGEFGRNDHSLDLRDLLNEPEHSRAYILGFSKTFENRKKDIRLFGEITNLQMPSTFQLRAQQSWYVHYQIPHGYTNYGQVIGAGIGPGGASQTIGLEWQSGLKRTGGFFERIVHNNDFYYSAFTPSQNWQKHWVDMSLNLTKSWNKGRILYDARLSFVHSLNYEWYYSNVFNCHAYIGITYLL